jgi:alpha-ketoglutarate-dependent taurine dioxygenase
MINQSLCFSVSRIPRPRLPITKRCTLNRKRHVRSLSTESWQDCLIEAAIEKASTTNPTQLVRVTFCPKSFGDLRKVSTLFHAAWLWHNDPSYIHASSGQRMRNVVSFFSSRAHIHSVQIAYPDSVDVQAVRNVNNEAIAPVRPIPPPPGSLHPIGGVSAISKSDLHSNLPVPKLDQALLQVIWDTAKGFIISYYDVSWLLRCRYDHWASIGDGDQVWEFDFGQKSETRSDQPAFQEFQYSELFLEVDTVKDDVKSCASTIHCFRLLQSIFENGAALLQNANNPYDNGTDFHDDKQPVAIVGKILSGGQLSHGQLYGDVFHVRDQEAFSGEMGYRDQTSAANNIAYTSMALCPHQDLAYYESIPGLQLLHCVANDPDNIIGGESTLIDVLKAAEQFRELAPTLFDILVKCEATFIKQRNNADMIYRRPHILLSPSSHDVTSVRWSPPFEGPLFLPPASVEEYFLAYAAFERMLDNSLPRYSARQQVGTSGTNQPLLPQLSSQLESELCDYAHEYTWEYRLKPGEILVFNNQRMLHGRRAYSIRNPFSDVGHIKGRHLVGCYTNIDDTLNTYRILRRSFFRDPFCLPFMRNVGNGSSSNF